MIFLFIVHSCWFLLAIAIDIFVIIYDAKVLPYVYGRSCHILTMDDHRFSLDTCKLSHIVCTIRLYTKEISKSPYICHFAIF